MKELVYESPLLIRARMIDCCGDVFEETKDPELRLGKFVIEADEPAEKVQLGALIYGNKVFYDKAKQSSGISISDYLASLSHDCVGNRLYGLGKTILPDAEALHVLGGGFMEIDDAQKVIKAYGYSSTCGSAPLELLERSLESNCLEYRVEAKALPHAILPVGKNGDCPRVRWFKNQGFNVQQHDPFGRPQPFL
ncbi:MAG: hypothetical protein AABY00_02165 [Nanoarchaeota archaeon]